MAVGVRKHLRVVSVFASPTCKTDPMEFGLVEPRDIADVDGMYGYQWVLDVLPGQEVCYEARLQSGTCEPLECVRRTPGRLDRGTFVWGREAADTIFEVWFGG